MKKIFTLSLFCLGALGAGMAHADAELSVKGKLQPSACGLAFWDRNGTHDLGVIPATQLNQSGSDDPYGSWSFRMDGEIGILISCSTPTKVALAVSDNRAGTDLGGQLINGTFGFGHYTANNSFGLGTANGKPIGEFALEVMGSAWLEGSIEAYVLKSSEGGPWEVDRGWYEPVFEKSGSRMTFGDANGVPMAFKEAAIGLAAHGALNKYDELDVRQTIVIDGSATVELIYL